MPRITDALSRHSQPRQRTSAGVSHSGGTAVAGPVGLDGTERMVIGDSKIGSCTIGAPGWFVIGQSEIGMGDIIGPGPDDRVKKARIGYMYLGRQYQIQ